MTDTRSEYLAKAKENLELVSTRLVELEALAEKKSGDARRKFKANLRGIRESRDQAARRLDDLRLASQPAWEDGKEIVERDQASLSYAVDNARKKFQ
jgi:hypothetical protein